MDQEEDEEDEDDDEKEEQREHEYSEEENEDSNKMAAVMDFLRNDMFGEAGISTIIAEDDKI